MTGARWPAAPAGRLETAGATEQAAGEAATIGRQPRLYRAYLPKEQLRSSWSAPPAAIALLDAGSPGHAAGIRLRQLETISQHYQGIVATLTRRLQTPASK
jgi:hypothetical protein